MLQVFSDTISVDSRLKALNLSVEPLISAVKRGMLARSETTPNHPPLHAGIATWSETVRSLRDALIPQGWSKSDEGNYSLTVDPTYKHAIVVATGNEDTGNPNRNPTTKTIKGRNTEHAVEVNFDQMVLFSELDPLLSGEDNKRLTWVLLFAIVGDKVKVELSLPIHCNGKIDSWRERIILPDIDFDSSTSSLNTPLIPDQPDIDIDVQLKNYG